MKYFSTLLLVFFSISLAQSQDQLRANLSFCSFWSPEIGSYMETYLSVNAATIVLEETGNGYQGTVEVTIIFKQGGKVANYKKYELNSPQFSDTTDIGINFIDQQRFTLDDGDYTFFISIRDIHGDSSAITHEQPVSIGYPNDKVRISGIELLDSYQKSQAPGVLTKSGYDMVPYVYDFYPSGISKMRFYTEIYHTNKVLGEDYDFIVNFFIQSYETGQVLSNMQYMKRKVSKSVIPLLQEFDISQLPSGNYSLVIEARNQQNELIASNSLYFQRINPKVQLQLKDISALDVRATFVRDITDMDTLADYIRSLSPISSELERVFAKKHLANADLGLMQQYFLNFWKERNNLNPEAAWKEYKERVDHVDEHFKTLIKKGYETDRGRVYLKYGPPNTISESHHEPAAYPYEIWHYYELRNQRNKRFVFYSRDIVTNDFELIHSDAIGELANYRWKLDVMKRTTDGFDLDRESAQDHWGGRIDTYYRNPR